MSIEDEKNEINNWIWDQTNGIVQTGPFKHMRLVREEVWKDGNQGTKLIGCYEQELHPSIEDEIVRLSKLRYPKILNVGCAEGYYAVGMAYRLNEAVVSIMDINGDAIKIAKKAALLNGVMVMEGTTLAEQDLIIMDCEGAETDYLDRTTFPDLDHANIIVECHDYGAGHIVNALTERFEHTHEIECLTAEYVRCPMDYPLLRGQRSHVKWLAVSEGRPNTMHFLVMQAHAHRQA